ncbi:MAG: DUF4943 domain-containing protein [Mediterranea sp.]|jgi:hypothetical protein|nr:DUF4943 domain-containing protein [Mediterranea sp.]
MKRAWIIYTVLSFFVFAGCSDDTLDYHNPDVRVFVKQLKSGTYKTKNDNGIVEVPLFTSKHIPQLLKYTEDMTEIPSFPLPSISSHFGGKARLGECVLWIIEGVRLGYYPSLGCKLLHNNAESYEGIYFLTNEEVLEAAALYRLWWEEVENTGTQMFVDTWSINPLQGSDYRWW